jgi:hypothetical protein
LGVTSEQAFYTPEVRLGVEENCSVFQSEQALFGPLYNSPVAFNPFTCVLTYKDRLEIFVLLKSNPLSVMLRTYPARLAALSKERFNRGRA